MKTFTDAEGRTWEVLVDVSTVRLVRTALGVDLMEVAAGDLLARFCRDPCLLVDILYVLSAPAPGFEAVKKEEFERAMRGDVLDQAAAALAEEILDFFPRARRLQALGKLVEAVHAEEAAVKEATRILAPLAAAETPAQAVKESEKPPPADDPAAAAKAAPAEAARPGLVG